MIFNKILFLGPHTDDELSCSATLSKFIEAGSQVFIAVFSFCEESVPEGFDKNVLDLEFDKVMQVLKIDPKNIFKYNFLVRYFPTYRQKILEELIVLKNKIKPDLVLLPGTTDIHQDHHVIAQEGIRAFNKTSSIFGYQLFHNVTKNNINGFSEIKDRHINIKIKSLSCYRSQEHRTYMKKQLVQSLAELHGIQSGVKMAETFEIIKLKF